MKNRLKLLACGVILATWLAATATAAEKDPAALLRALNTLRVDSGQIYLAREIHLRRDVVRISFDEGKLGFLTAADGRVTGVVFTGHGRAIALPRDPIEKASLVRFVGTPLLDQKFSRAYLRFSDNAADELRAQLQAAGAQRLEEPSFAEDWNLVLADVNAVHSLRILADLLSTDPQPYFYAGLTGDATGAFDVFVDNRRDEQILLGQSNFIEGARHFDVWASISRSDLSRTQPSFTPAAYSIATTISADHALEGEATVTLKASRSGERVLAFELSRQLIVTAAADEAGRALPFFREETIAREDLATRGDALVYVMLAEPPAAGQEFRLRLTYRGNALSESGGTYFPGERGGWYPRAACSLCFTPFRLSFRYPRTLHVVATGKPAEDHEEGEWRTSRWETETPTLAAGFALGNFSKARSEASAPKFEFYSAGRLDAAQAASAGQEIAEALRFYSNLFGPFPGDLLSVVPTSGSLGKGWPGLIGFSGGRHEQAWEQDLARQWLGGAAASANYHDQWISEGLTRYAGLMYEESKQPGSFNLLAHLEADRDDLIRKQKDTSETPEEVGPLVLGYRLSSSRSPRAAGQVLSLKGAWVFQMLRMMLRDPAAENPDARFAALLQSVVVEHRGRALSTLELQRAVEKVMTPSMALEGPRTMDWFFDQWVRGTGVPHFSVTYEVRPLGQAFVVRGKLKQSHVPESFLAPVPLYAARADGKQILLGTVVTAGPETPFKFTLRSAPKKILVDPYMTLLCVRE